MTDLATQDYMAEVARRVRPAGAARLLLLVIICCFVALVAWAHLTALDQVTRGQGKVIPSGELQVVQNLEGGIISEILVQEGERVRAGQVILRLDRTVFTGDFNRLRQRYYAARPSRRKPVTARRRWWRASRPCSRPAGPSCRQNCRCCSRGCCNGSRLWRRRA